MREIQDLTLQVERGLQGIEALFQQRALTLSRLCRHWGRCLASERPVFRYHQSMWQTCQANLTIIRNW